MVLYDYETEALDELLKGYGFKVGFGSYSDICKLEHLGIAGFNFGCGYHNAHSKDAYLLVHETKAMVERFVEFYRAESGNRMEYVPEPEPDVRFDSYGALDYDPDCRYLDEEEWDRVTARWRAELRREKERREAELRREEERREEEDLSLVPWWKEDWDEEWIRKNHR